MKLKIILGLVAIVTLTIAVFAPVYGQTETQTENTNVKTVTIVQGAHNEEHGQPDYDPPVITVKPGDKVIWKNEDYPDKTDPYAPDTIQHTATSGLEPVPDGWFLTDILNSGESSEPIENAND